MGEELPAPTGPVDAASGGVDTVATPLPIGEVLSLLQDEFPDVTISKIRFLESQGLIQPERTASGYRRFSSADIERLQWILHQQRDNFLPLKVIRRMIEEGIDRYDPSGGTQPTLFSSTVQDVADEAPADDDADRGGAGLPADPGRSAAPQPRRSPAHPAVASAPQPPRGERRVTTSPATVGRPGGPSEQGGPVVTGGRERGNERRPTSSDPPEPSPGTMDASATGQPDVQAGAAAPGRQPHETPADVVAALQEDPRAGRRQGGGPPRPDRPLRRPAAEAVPDDVQLGADDLCTQTGIEFSLLADLERFGLVQSQSLRGGERTYGRAAVEVARLAARYEQLGVEPRHLRMYLVSAEREAGMVEQLAVPLLKQRNPDARQHASELTSELVELGADLHRALLRRELGGDLLP